MQSDRYWLHISWLQISWLIQSSCWFFLTTEPEITVSVEVGYFPAREWTLIYLHMLVSWPIIGPGQNYSQWEVKGRQFGKFSSWQKEEILFAPSLWMEEKKKNREKWFGVDVIKRLKWTNLKLTKPGTLCAGFLIVLGTSAGFLF